MTQNISEAKSVSHEGDRILGYQEKGGLLALPDGKIGALKHNIHRYNHGSDKPWGRDQCAYVEADIIPVGYHIEIPPPDKTLQAVAEWLAAERNGQRHPHATVGAEVEAVTYDRALSLTPAHGTLWPLEQNRHPELLSHMLETATDKTSEGNYPRTAVEAARALAAAVNEAEEIAAMQGKILVYSSVPEKGSADDVQITPHPYLLAFSPKVLNATLSHKTAIPEEVIFLYNRIGIDIVPFLEQTGILNWPVNALHVHSGVPQIDGLADPRSAYAMALVRMTELAKILSLMLYNTRHCFGHDTGLKDVRSIMRRLLATSHDSTLPDSAGEFIRDAVTALENGAIHSLPRHPWQGQHDRVRIRMDGEKKTIESIDAAMNPDLRIVLGWIFANQLMNTLALDALETVGGNESLVLPYLEGTYGNLLSPIPALGPVSSFSHDLLFNRGGYNAVVPWFRNKTYRDLLMQAETVMQRVGHKYPGLTHQFRILSHLLRSQTEIPNKYAGIAEYMGTSTGEYRPNGLNLGLLTDAKIGDLEDIVTSQSEGTRLQAISLATVRDEKDLEAWCGI